MSRILIPILLLFLLAACSAAPDNPNTDEPDVHPQELPTTAPLPPTSIPPADLPVTAPGETPSSRKPMPPSGEDTLPVTPYAPLSSDTAFKRSSVFIETIDLLVMESFPPQISLQLTGSLPTPCHQLRVKTNPPDAENRIDIEVYSVVNPGMMCAQVLSPFDANVQLGSFPVGHYSVWINGEKIGEFDA
jgi:hypothetical protein